MIYFCKWCPYDKYYILLAQTDDCALFDVIPEALVKTYKKEHLVALRCEWRGGKRVFFQDHDFDDIFEGTYNSAYRISGVF